MRYLLIFIFSVALATQKVIPDQNRIRIGTVTSDSTSTVGPFNPTGLFGEFIETVDKPIQMPEGVVVTGAFTDNVNVEQADDASMRIMPGIETIDPRLWSNIAHSGGVRLDHYRPESSDVDIPLEVGASNGNDEGRLGKTDGILITAINQSEASKPKSESEVFTVLGIQKPHSTAPSLEVSAVKPSNVTIENRKLEGISVEPKNVMFFPEYDDAGTLPLAVLKAMEEPNSHFVSGQANLSPQEDDGLVVSDSSENCATYKTNNPAASNTAKENEKQSKMIAVNDETTVESIVESEPNTIEPDISTIVPEPDLLESDFSTNKDEVITSENHNLIAPTIDMVEGGAVNGSNATIILTATAEPVQEIPLETDNGISASTPVVEVEPVTVKTTIKNYGVPIKIFSTTLLCLIIVLNCLL